MSIIDWSKAPEEATHYLNRSQKPGVGVWCKRDGSAWVSVYADGVDKNWSYEPDDFEGQVIHCGFTLIQRPSSPAWPGEGLPPVGMVCEYNASCQRDSGKELWCEVLIKYQSEWVVVFECTKAPAGHEASVGVELFGYVSTGLENRFRLIRTPEQIAAEEALSEIESLYSEGGPAAVYDAGYRKVEQGQ